MNDSPDPRPELQATNQVRFHGLLGSAPVNRAWQCVLAMLVCLLNGFFSGCSLGPENGSQRSPVATAPMPPIRFYSTNYHGWSGAILISNKRAEVIVVPEIGRIMQFKFSSDPSGPLWENRAMDGASPDPQSNVWGNFGGDKTWPAPQADWPKITSRAWPPPVAFDSMPVTVRTDRDRVIMTSGIDPSFGIRTFRVLQLDPARPVLTVVTTYVKETGRSVRVAVWTITQFHDPVSVVVPIPRLSQFAGGYSRQSDVAPAGLRVERGLLSLARDAKNAHKIGTDASTLFWVGEALMLRIDSPRVPRFLLAHTLYSWPKRKGFGTHATEAIALS